MMGGRLEATSRRGTGPPGPRRALGGLGGGGDFETRHGFAGPRRALGGLGGHFGAPHVIRPRRRRAAGGSARRRADRTARWWRSARRRPPRAAGDRRARRW